MTRTSRLPGQANLLAAALKLLEVVEMDSLLYLVYETRMTNIILYLIYQFGAKYALGLSLPMCLYAR